MDSLKSKTKPVSLDDSNSDLHQSPSRLNNPLRSKKRRHATQMSIIPEKEEAEVSPSIVEIERKRKQDRAAVEGFKLQLDPVHMTRTEMIKKQQRDLMLNL